MGSGLASNRSYLLVNSASLASLYPWGSRTSAIFGCKCSTSSRAGAQGGCPGAGQALSASPASGSGAKPWRSA